MLNQEVLMTEGLVPVMMATVMVALGWLVAKMNFVVTTTEPDVTLPTTMSSAAGNRTCSAKRKAFALKLATSPPRVKSVLTAVR